MESQMSGLTWGIIIVVAVVVVVVGAFLIRKFRNK
jgi:Sec-independent protein translocase protein TatA